MADLNDRERANALRLIEWALIEDTRDVGDLTSLAVLPADLKGEAFFRARADGVLAGLPVIAELVAFRKNVPGSEPVTFETPLEDGTKVFADTALGVLRGSMRELLLLERTALNFLQRLCGIATLTRQFVDLVDDLPVQIYDTRKTTPGWRALEKYAVRCGGGTNHRTGLHDGVLIKDNHLAAMAKFAPERGAITHVVQLARAKYDKSVEIEVEVDNLQQFDEALACRPDAILLDNMALDDLRECVQRRQIAELDSVILEASGGVTFSTVREIAETQVDRISVGALTHSASALDIGLDYHFS